MSAIKTVEIVSGKTKVKINECDFDEKIHKKVSVQSEDKHYSQMNKTELQAELVKLGVEFDAKATNDALKELVKKSFEDEKRFELQAELETLGIEFNDDATNEDLQTLVTANQTAE